MKLIHKLAVAGVFALVSFAASAASAVTIDRMVTGQPVGYGGYFPERGFFQVFNPASFYELSDGSTWQSGAGVHSHLTATLAGVDVRGDLISYRFDVPENAILFQSTDFGFGDHAAQGTLAAPRELVMTAQLGSGHATLRGYTTILSNDRIHGDVFNAYSAPVGSRVYFEQNFTLNDATFGRDLFDTSFLYQQSGFVDFTRVMAAPVPEPATYAMLLAGLVGVSLTVRRRRVAPPRG